MIIQRAFSREILTNQADELA